MASILIVDDERSIRNSLKEILEHEDFIIETAESGHQALEILKQKQADLVLCDIKMPQMDGIELLEILQKEYSSTPVVMISGHGDIETAVECLKKGAYDFLQKPLDLNRILVTVRNALDKSKLITETKNLRKKIYSKYEMVGSSAEIKKVHELIEKIAPTDARVLITGENGTGKELVAHMIHEKSQRSAGPFVEVNCAAIPSELIESELFGHEKGSFTSAIKQRLGKFEQANGGTLFLDEIGDMSLSAQAKVLRALQENKITRVGSEKDIPVNVRIIAATNKNLREEIEKQNFREDLYHRLSVIVIQVPSLNERKEDIPELVNYFLNKICNEYGIPPKTIDDKAVLELQKYNYKGNIRELHNIIERLIILGEQTITMNDVKKYVL
ncbi:MAG: sigma-54-dependent Fis family transcriptional regulator [Bacteroidales bacterium]|jgi:DNA-binding NtrC family response regulator|nr:sigma-54-dependent Fis family transcriptional regulator [Bacteroidales bacterium]